MLGEAQDIPEVVTGEPLLTHAAARIVEAYRKELPRDSAARMMPPSKLDMERVRQAIIENGGTWRPIRDMVKMSTWRAVQHETPVSSVRYGLAAWRNEQERKQKEKEKRAGHQDHPIHPAYYEPYVAPEPEPITDDDRDSIRRQIAETIAKLKGET